MPAIRAEGLAKSFGDLIAVDDLALSVREGEIFGLVGPDGAGKTTTMRLLTGIMEPTAGDAWVAGRHVVREAEAIKDDIAYMSQRFGLYPDLTVIENIDFYADLYGMPRRGRGERIEELLAFSNLTPFKKRQAGKLSGGMKQKLGLACALIHRPRVLLLDEPTTGVDPVSRRELWRLLYELLGEGITVVTSTAYLDEAERCHRLALLHRGRALLCDAPQRLKAAMPGLVIAVTSSSPAAVRDALRPLPEVTSLHVMGDAVRVVVPPAVPTDAIGDALRAAGVPVDDIAVVAPTIEDLFVATVSAAEISA